MRVLGIETEYGMFIEGSDPSHHLDEAAALVRAYSGPHATGWDYRFEDPRCDARGFRARRLAANPEDARYDRPGAAPRSQEEIRSDRVLANGARLYNDHGHPEYSTPECLSPREVTAHDRAGERIVLACARARAAALGLPIRIYKNNTDFHGMSYGTHENYLTSRAVPFDHLLAGLMPFFVTRPIFAGAGKVGVEPDGGGEVPFQLSQRADFFTEEASVDTLHRRPILNTRDEPHADPQRYRRLHVICGDANMSPFATWLKVGTTALVLALIEQGWQPALRVLRPVEAIQRLSRDPSLAWLVDADNGRSVPAVEIQRLYLHAALDAGFASEPEFTEVTREWERILDSLEHDPFSLTDCLDWVAKRHLIETYREAEGLSWSDESLRSLDLEYHNVDPDAGLYHALESEGAMRQVVSEDEVAAAMECAPAGTRAAARGACVREFGPAIQSITWSHVVVGTGSDALALDLSDPFDAMAGRLDNVEG